LHLLVISIEYYDARNNEYKMVSVTFSEILHTLVDINQQTDGQGVNYASFGK